MSFQIIGIGNEFRQDDAIGILMIHELQQHIVEEDIHLTTFTGDGVKLMECWSTDDWVILIDAVQSGAPSGTIHRVDATKNEIPAQLMNTSTHSVSIADAVELSRTLGTLPHKLLIFGVEGQSFQQRIGLSPNVKQAIPQLLKTILSEINDWRNDA